MLRRFVYVEVSVDLEEEVDCRVPQVRDADAFQNCLPVCAGLSVFLDSLHLHDLVCFLGSVPVGGTREPILRLFSVDAASSSAPAPSIAASSPSGIAARCSAALIAVMGTLSSSILSCPWEVILGLGI